MALIIVKSCANAFEAEVIKGALDSADIPCMVQGENISFIRSGIGCQSAFPVNILVEEQDVERAIEFLNSQEVEPVD